MKKITILIIALVLVLGMPVPAQAQGDDNHNVKGTVVSMPAMFLQSGVTWYVDSANGRFGAACTQADPCIQFTEAQTKAGAGDTILLIGTFGSINIIKDDLHVRGVEETNPARMTTIDGSRPGSHSRCVRVQAKRVTVSYLYVTNCVSHGIIAMAAAEDILIGHNFVRWAVLERLSGSGWGSCLKIEFGKRVTMRFNRVDECHGEGIAVSGIGPIIIHSNVVGTSFSVMIYDDNSSDVYILYNHVLCTDDTRFRRHNRPAVGIIVAEEDVTEWNRNWGAQSRNHVIVGNYVEGCPIGIGVWRSDIGRPLNGLRVEDNIVPRGYGSVQDAISVDAATCVGELIIRNNRVWKTNIWVRCSGGDPRTISNNTLFTTIGTPTPGGGVTVTPSTPVPATLTPTSAPTNTPTRTLTPSITPTRTPTASVTPSLTPTGTIPPTNTHTATTVPPSATPVIPTPTVSGVPTPPNRPPDGCGISGNILTCVWILP